MSRNRTARGAALIAATGIALTAMTAALATVSGCAATRTAETDKDALFSGVDTAIADFKRKDPGLELWFDHAYGFAIFPRVEKAAIGVGGAGGEGVVYNQGVSTGNSRLAQGTIGLQLGGQSFREVIFFEDAASLAEFTDGSFELAATINAIAAEEGSASKATYQDGVAVFTVSTGGLMFEASVGGQTFDYAPW